MSSLLGAVLQAAFKWVGEKLNNFFKTQRGKNVRGLLAKAGALISAVAAKTDNEIDDALGEVLSDLGMADKPLKELLDGPLGGWIRNRAVYKLLKKDSPDSSDSEINLSIELALNRIKERGGVKFALDRGKGR